MKVIIQYSVIRIVQSTLTPPPLADMGVPFMFLEVLHMNANCYFCIAKT